MSKILVDSNIILDILTEDPVWLGWSTKMLSHYVKTHDLVINPIIYAEISVGFQTMTEFESVMKVTGLLKEALPYKAAFIAGKAFRDYRKRGGIRHSPLPDFYIGAHASIAEYQLITRDYKRYQTYFSDVELIYPQEES